MTLLLDAGNTRLKWALSDAAGRLGPVGSLAYTELAELPGWLAGRLAGAEPGRILGCNVAGDAVAAELAAVLPHAIDWLVPAAEQAGVRNAYAEPARLGADRWAALIGAYHRHRADLVLVSCGTAITVDCLDRDGRFHGGTIAPGLELMLESLRHGTANLGRRPGCYAVYPDNTGDAIYSGCVNALAAQADAAAARFAADLGRPVRLLVSGGDAATVLPRLAHDAVIVDNLALIGLAYLAYPLC